MGSIRYVSGPVSGAIFVSFLRRSAVVSHASRRGASLNTARQTHSCRDSGPARGATVIVSGVATGGHQVANLRYRRVMHIEHPADLSQAQFTGVDLVADAMTH
jgi:hypothetical protein